MVHSEDLKKGLKMKVKDLITELSKHDMETEVGISAGDDILGDYEFNLDLRVEEEIGYLDNRGTLWQIISNYRRVTDKPISILVIS